MLTLLQDFWWVVLMTVPVLACVFWFTYRKTGHDKRFFGVLFIIVSGLVCFGYGLYGGIVEQHIMYFSEPSRQRVDIYGPWAIALGAVLMGIGGGLVYLGVWLLRRLPPKKSPDKQDFELRF